MLCLKNFHAQEAVVDSSADRKGLWCALHHEQVDYAMTWQGILSLGRFKLFIAVWFDIEELQITLSISFWIVARPRLFVVSVANKDPVEYIPTLCAYL